MSALTIYSDDAMQRSETSRDFSYISQQLKNIGVQFERWNADIELDTQANSDSILAAYHDSIARLNAQYGFQSVDVIHVNNSHPDKIALREKFLAEHCHADFEIRFFVRGCGLFYLHVEHKVYLVLCEQGDLISVPANTPHWFDLGTEPQLSVIRLFTTHEGWLATFTGSDIARLFPSLNDYQSELL